MPEAGLTVGNFPSDVGCIPCGVRGILIAGCGISTEGDFNFIVHAFLSAMPRPRQRMLSRRGSCWGNPSRPSAGSGSMGQAPPPLGTESILRPSQYLDPNSPDSSNLPSFGSAIFSFNCSLNRPRIMAHVSVLFLE